MESNYEYGLGRPDIVVKDLRHRRVIIFEAKISVDEAGMEKDCMEALRQIKAREYAAKFLDGYETVLCYGIAFYKKECTMKKST